MIAEKSDKLKVCVALRMITEVLNINAEHHRKIQGACDVCPNRRPEGEEDYGPQLEYVSKMIADYREKYGDVSMSELSEAEQSLGVVLGMCGGFVAELALRSSAPPEGVERYGDETPETHYLPRGDEYVRGRCVGEDAEKAEGLKDCHVEQFVGLDKEQHDCAENCPNRRPEGVDVLEILEAWCRENCDNIDCAAKRSDCKLFQLLEQLRREEP